MAKSTSSTRSRVLDRGTVSLDSVVYAFSKWVAESIMES
jgi:hypothetical protein